MHQKLLYFYLSGRGGGVRGVGRGGRGGSPVKGRGPIVFSRTPRGRGRGGRAGRGRGRGASANLSGMSPLNRSMVRFKLCQSDPTVMFLNFGTSENFAVIYLGSAVAWWQMPWTPDPDRGFEPHSGQTVLCP